MKSRGLWAWLLLGVTVIFAIAPVYRSGVEIPVREHHLLHAVMLIGAALSGLLFAGRAAAPARGRAAWLLLSVLAPMLAMLLMWPSDYAPLERFPVAHVAEHVGLLLCGFLTAYAGQQYAAGIGVAMSLSLWAMAFLAAWGFGVSPPLQVAEISNTATRSQGAAAVPVVNLAQGATIFQQNCAACHGAHGQGGMGPSLVGESARKNVNQAVQWIESPAAPMPTLYPATLNEQDVREVAAYVESLR